MLTGTLRASSFELPSLPLREAADTARKEIQREARSNRNTSADGTITMTKLWDKRASDALNADDVETRPPLARSSREPDCQGS